MSTTAAWGAAGPDSGIVPMTIDRRALRPGDVDIAIHYCGVCHSDLHTARNDWKGTRYPVVPGHEIVGIVRAVGAGVDRFAVGDRVGVGCMVDSCLECESCRAGDEQYCENGNVGTYNSKDRIDATATQGGYSSEIVVRQEFVLRVPETLDAARVAPLLCAGITTYSPLRYWKVGPGTRVAVAGLGGLGHMGVKLAVGLGAEVTVVTTSPSKVDDAFALGAHAVLLASDKPAMRAARNTFDLVLDTIPVAHEMAPYLGLAKASATLVMVGAIEPISLHSWLLLGGRRNLAGSTIGGIAETQELLDFCAERGILPDCELIPMAQINEAYARMERADVKYRFVIDMSTLAPIARS